MGDSKFRLKWVGGVAWARHEGKQMPIIKVSKFERDEWRQRVWHGRLRLAALAISGLMLLATLALWTSHALTGPMPVVSVPTAKAINGTAAVVGKATGQ